MAFMTSDTAKDYLINSKAKFNFIESPSGILPQVIEKDNYDSTNSNKVIYDNIPPDNKFPALNLIFETAEPCNYWNLYISVISNYNYQGTSFYVFYSSNCQWGNQEFGYEKSSRMSSIFEFIFELLDKYKVDPESINENLRFE